MVEWKEVHQNEKVCPACKSKNIEVIKDYPGSSWLHCKSCNVKLKIHSKK